MNPRSECEHAREQFSGYLDGDLTGKAMQELAAHLACCPGCNEEFEEWRSIQHFIGQLGPAKPPTDLSLRLRIAISREQASTFRQRAARWQVRWENTVRPLMLQASAGLASTVLLIGTLLLLIGTFAAPEPLSARDEPLGMATSPRFLYSTFDDISSSAASNPVVVKAYVNGDGKVYDYRIVSGPTDAKTKEAVENMLVFSVFEPARIFGEPVRGQAILSFSGVAVQG